MASHSSEVLLEENITVMLSFPNGSTASITYAENGHSSTSKERLEVLGRGHTIVIDDFQALNIDGKDVKLAKPGKGHVENLALFAGVIRGDLSGRSDTMASISSTATVLAAARSLIEGTVVAVDTRIGQQAF